MSFKQKLKNELCENERKLPPKRAFVKQCFLKGGAISNPERTYHLEFSCASGDAKRLALVLEGFGLRPKSTKRNEKSVLYIKDAEEIADCMKIMGAAKNLLLFEEIRVRKQVSNNINRRVNFEAANLGKLAGSALEQIETIKAAKARFGLENLPKALEDVARARLENENLTLEEIGRLLSPPIGKSGVSHRMRKLRKLVSE